jgi:hypothetical protein
LGLRGGVRAAFGLWSACCGVSRVFFGDLDLKLASGPVVGDVSGDAVRVARVQRCSCSVFSSLVNHPMLRICALGGAALPLDGGDG